MSARGLRQGAPFMAHPFLSIALAPSSSFFLFDFLNSISFYSLLFLSVFFFLSFFFLIVFHPPPSACPRSKMAASDSSPTHSPSTKLPAAPPLPAATVTSPGVRTTTHPCVHTHGREGWRPHVVGELRRTYNSRQDERHRSRPDSERQSRALLGFHLFSSCVGVAF